MKTSLIGFPTKPHEGNYQALYHGEESPFDACTQLG
jgi:hypothetical protein